MKTLKWIIGLSIPIIAVLLAYTLNKKSPDVRYTLSKGISITSFQEVPIQPAGDKISVQELVVKNLGNNKAENIQIKIRGKVIKYDLIKNFASDEPKIIRNDDIFNLLYPGLPPAGSFTLIFSSRGSGVWGDEISISDQNGLCKQAFSQSKISLGEIFSSVFLGVLYFAMLLFTIISYLMDRWKVNLKYKNYHEIISKRKPFYASDESWNEVVSEALEETIKEDYFLEAIQESLCYKILCSTKPQLLAEHVWLPILNKCNSELESKFVKKMDYLYGENIIKLLQIERPQHFPQNKWERIQEDLNKRYISYLKNDILFLNLEKIIAEIKRNKPVEIWENYWKKYVEYLKREYKNLATGELSFKNQPFTYLENIKLDEVLENERDKEEVRERAYKVMLQNTMTYFDYASAVRFLEFQKPEWLKVDDYEKIKNQANQVVKYYKFAKLFELLNSIFINQILPLEKPDYLSEREWLVILEIEKKLKNK